MDTENNRNTKATDSDSGSGNWMSRMMSRGCARMAKFCGCGDMMEQMTETSENRFCCGTEHKSGN